MKKHWRETLICNAVNVQVTTVFTQRFFIFRNTQHVYRIESSLSVYCFTGISLCLFRNFTFLQPICEHRLTRVVLANLIIVSRAFDFTSKEISTNDKAFKGQRSNGARKIEARVERLWHNDHNRSVGWCRLRARLRNRKPKSATWHDQCPVKDSLLNARQTVNFDT